MKKILFLFIILNVVIDSITYVSANEGNKNHNNFHNHSKKSHTQLSLKAYLPNEINESSGLSYTDGKLWTHNDSGGLPAIYNIDTSTGVIKQTVFIDNYPNIDWEDISADKDHIYVGDFGNNYGIRKNLRVLIIDKKALSDSAIVHVKANAINFSYSDQHEFIKNNKNDYDCESIISIKNHLYLFSKDRGDNRTRVYRLSKTPGTYILTPYTEFNSNGRVCGASYNKDIHQLALIGYMPKTVNSFLWLIDDFKDEDFFSGTQKRIEIGKGKKHWKTEGIAYESTNRLFISCENTESEKGGLYLFVTDEK